jgi:hypothetical protein
LLQVLLVGALVGYPLIRLGNRAKTVHRIIEDYPSSNTEESTEAMLWCVLSAKGPDFV